MAYDLSEELCQSAKRLAKSLDPDGSNASAIDWHIEFGQLKNDLSEIRRDYETIPNTIAPYHLTLNIKVPVDVL